MQKIYILRGNMINMWLGIGVVNLIYVGFHINIECQNTVKESTIFK